MAGKKRQEIQLQREIETQEEWEEVMAKEGLWVIDVYQEWCGPCQALVGNFRRLKNELGDALLNYAVAKADTIDGLDKYRGRCEPTFLFFAGGILVSFIHGANAPKLQRIITEQLAHEHKVLDGNAERKEVKDAIVTRLEEKAIEGAEAQEAAREAEDGDDSYTLQQSKEEEEDAEVAKGVTVAIIKPDAVAQGKADEIIQEMKDQGIEILAQEMRELTEEEATELYSELKNEAYFSELIKFITSGPSHLLVLSKGTTGATVIKDWRDMIGPTQVEAAKEEAPDSLRAKYGESGYMNALHGSSSTDSAARELAFFFPNLAIPTYKKKKLNIQRTLALIRPEAFSAKKDEILAKITEAGFKIAMYKEVQLTREQVSDFYKEHEGQSYFDQLVEHMTSGPVLALGLAGDEAISSWRDMLGPPNVDDATETSPGSLRAEYTGQSGINQFHGSDSEEAAKKELNFFFAMEETVAVIKPSGMGTKDAIIDRIHEAGFKIAARKETTITRDIAEMLYPDHADKEYYIDLIESMISGPTMFMVLSREDAVDGWRQEIGETNPEDAKVTNPESIRAQYGQDTLNNAVHGSSNKTRVKAEMKAIFGDLEFNDDGTVKGEEPELDEVTDALKKDETVADETTDADETADTTQDVTADTTTQDGTADTTQPDQTQEATVDEGETNEGATAEADTTVADTTTQDETADTTQADTTQADTTLADTTQADTTQADTTQADTTQADTTTAEVGAAEQSNEATPQDETAASTTDQTNTTETETTAEESTAKGESTPSDAKVEETPKATEEEKPAEESSPQTKEPESQSKDASQSEEPAADTQAVKKADSPTPEAAPQEVKTTETPAADAAPQEEVKKADSPAPEVKKADSPAPEVKKADSPAPEAEAQEVKTTDAPAPEQGTEAKTSPSSDEADAGVKGEQGTGDEAKKADDTAGAGDSTEAADKPAETS